MNKKDVSPSGGNKPIILKGPWNERWRKILHPAKLSDYYISDYGRIKAVDRGTKNERELKGSKGNAGYRRLNLRLEDDRRLSIYIHKFVAEHFIEKTKEDEELKRIYVVHINRDKTNNHYNNLKRVNRAELTQRHKEMGVISHEVNKKKLLIKMNETKVLILKKRLKAGKTKKKILAKQFDITMTQLRRIESGENWGHVKLEEDSLENK